MQASVRQIEMVRLASKRKSDVVWEKALNDADLSSYSKMTKLLLEDPLRISQLDAHRLGAYMVDVIHNKKHTDLKKFLQAGVSPDMVDYYKSPLLSLCVYAKNEEGARILLQYGAAPNKRDANKHTPLALAAYYKRKTILFDLLMAGAYDQTLLPSLLKMEKHKNMARYLLDVISSHPIPAVSWGRLCTEKNMKPVDFTVVPKLLPYKMSPLKAAFKCGHLRLIEHAFDEQLMILEKNPSNRNALLTVLAILKHPSTCVVDMQMKLARALFFNESGRCRFAFVDALQNGLDRTHRIYKRVE